jgi:hypothetical protein
VKAFSIFRKDRIHSSTDSTNSSKNKVSNYSSFKLELIFRRLIFYFSILKVKKDGSLGSLRENIFYIIFFQKNFFFVISSGLSYDPCKSLFRFKKTSKMGLIVTFSFSIKSFVSENYLPFEVLEFLLFIFFSKRK